MIKEADVFNILREEFRSQNSDVLSGVTEFDDCAILPINNNTCLVQTTDFSRGMRFSMGKLGYLTWFDVGYYVVTANLSDIAASGAVPISFQNVLRYTKEMTSEDITQFFRGINTACKDHNTICTGGDTGSYEIEVIVGTACGLVDPKKVLNRRGARPGNLLCVTNMIGRMNTAMVYFNKTIKEAQCLSHADEELLKDSWRKPQAPIIEGLLLSGQYEPGAKKLATSCMDVSDGLTGALQTLAHASQVGFEIIGTKLPIDQTANILAGSTGYDPYELALGMAPDFGSLLFTLDSEDLKTCRETFERKNCKFSVIGKTTGTKKVLFRESMGAKTEPFPGAVWTHVGFEEYFNRFVIKK